MPEEISAQKRYRWGKLHGWSFLVIGLGIFVAGPWAGEIAKRASCYAIGAILVVIGSGLLGKRRYGFVLFAVFGAVVVGGAFIFPTPNLEVYAFIAGWWVIPAIFYFPKRWKEMR